MNMWKPTLRRLHLLVGISGVIGFLLTGQYMDLAHDHLRGMTDARRLLFRSGHIYILLTSLINLGLGVYLVSKTGWRKWVQLFGSFVVVTSPFVAAVGFFHEPWMEDIFRPYSRFALYGMLGGMVFHLITIQKENRP